jgi:Flp pilus assembly protein TadG
MKNIFTRFVRNRRGAIALIFAGSLLPLVMLVGLSIDYSFYVQARSQFALASDASATYAIREATAAYALNGYNSSTAETAGDASGTAWFNSQLATLPTASIQGGSPSVDVQSNQNLSSTNPAGFQATVTYTGLYPPFFNGLFKQTSKWTVSGSSQANSQYSYVEVLLLLDTSGSMLISADAAGALTMEDNTVCINSSNITDHSGFDGIGGYLDPNNIVNWSNVQNIKSGTSGRSAQCKQGYNGAWTPCAFACHTNPTIVNGYTGDFYGEARRLGVQLKTDTVFSATEAIINTMKNSNQVPGQFTLGAYQFNDDACPIFQGNTSSGDALAEATSNLSGALSTINADDYNITPTETAFPPLVNSGETDDFTDFPQSVRDLVSGNFKCLSTTNANASPTVITGKPLAPLPPTSITPGTEAQYPEKDIFIVSDGLSDTSSTSACKRYMGEITGASAERNGTIQNVCAQANGAAPTASCQSLKNLGFTVYVLDISYPAVVVPTYYTPDSGGNNSNNYIASDFPLLTNTNGNPGDPNVWNSVQAGSSLTPLQQGMQACASSPSDFFMASSAADIQTAMSQMLKSALDSAIRITQ